MRVYRCRLTGMRVHMEKRSVKHGEQKRRYCAAGCQSSQVILNESHLEARFTGLRSNRGRYLFSTGASSENFLNSSSRKPVIALYSVCSLPLSRRGSMTPELQRNMELITASLARLSAHQEQFEAWTKDLLVQTSQLLVHHSERMDRMDKIYEQALRQNEQVLHLLNMILDRLPIPGRPN
jgi:hypothetical protein